ncbi:MAG: glycosyltransferase family 4 protein [Phormidesmis sp.]
MTTASEEPANILCLGDTWFPSFPGGLDRYVYELTAALAADCDRIELMGVSLPQNDFASTVKLLNIGRSDQSLLKRLWATRTTFSHRELERLDAINFHFALYSFALLAQLPKQVPLTFTFHGPWALESDWEGGNKLGIAVKRWIERQVYRRCDRFIVLSKAFGQILHESYRVPWQKIHVIPGGVNVESFQPTLERSQARAQLNWPTGRFILFTPRRLVHRMGLDKLLSALVEVKRQRPDVLLVIAGKGPLRDALEAQTVALGLQEHVRFLGFLPEVDLPVAYQAADLTVIPSQSLEGFGLILLESLACGTPALCTPVGGMPEVLSNFSPQLITDSAQTEAIAQKLAAVASGQIDLPGRAACRTYAVENFDWAVIAQKVRQVLLSPV